MDADEQARLLCARAIATDDPHELDEILAQLHGLLHENIARLQAIIEQRRLRVDREHVLATSA